MMAKIDWLHAKTIYLSKPACTMKDIAIKFGVNETTVKERASKENWTGDRAKTLLIADQKMPEKLGETIADIKARHATIARLMQALVLKALHDFPDEFKPRNFVEAVKTIKIAIDIERQAYDMDKPQDSYSPPPETRSILDAIGMVYGHKSTSSEKL